MLFNGHFEKAGHIFEDTVCETSFVQHSLQETIGETIQQTQLAGKLYFWLKDPSHDKEKWFLILLLL